MRAFAPTTGILAAAVSALMGWIVVLTPVGLSLMHWSYDLLQPFLPGHAYTDPVVIHMDQQALQDYHLQPGEPWPRALHARLLDRLSRDQACVVVFDVTFTQEGDPASDETLARAMRRNGRVVLAGDRVPVRGVALSYTLIPPLPLFETNAAAWGTAKIHLDADRVARRYDAGNDQEPGLDWAAATVAGAPITQNPAERLREARWLNYYGSARPFETTSMSYSNAESKEPGFFSGKAVFIGGKPETLLRGEVTDLFGTPFTRWNSSFIPGVEIAAIAYANLMNNESLRRLGLLPELAAILFSGCLLGFGLQHVRRPHLWWVTLLTLLAIGIASVGFVLAARVWIPWTVVGLVQLPCVLFFRVLRMEPSPHQGSDPGSVVQEKTRLDPVPAGSAPAQVLVIPDHTLIRCIGEGAYGQVWIARNAVGIYHAVKVVYRNRFGTDVPYERAFRGIQKFMPISRSHDGFVNLLHVGRNDAIGLFFYIMEVGDDQRMDQQIDPAAYSPRTLASELKRCEMLPTRDCLEFMLALTAAVDRLHQHQLVHRDIKPANLIFVHRRPKLADIDLVTDLSEHGDVSRIGTEGYMAPEGPGTAAADVFALGRVLYVALTGKQPEQIPELPTRAMTQPDSSLMLELNRIACKACEVEVSRRYPSAAAMQADLMEISQRLKPGSGE